MAKDYAKGFYASEAWRKTRRAYLLSRGGICERCRKEYEQGRRSLASLRPGVIVHHRRYITPDNINDSKVTLSFDNLELLCDDHHNKEHGRSEWRYRFDAEGNVIEI